MVCCSAGSDGPEPMTISTPGIHPAAITAGAADDHRAVDRSDDTVAPFSSRGPTPDGVTKPDVVLPGVKITSLLAPLSLLARQQEQRPRDKRHPLTR
ncbi:MAG: S8 family serine peptidase [Bacillota bacterium]